MTREEAIKWLDGLSCDYIADEERRALWVAIAALKAGQSRQAEWIPVSERLPEDDREVLLISKLYRNDGSFREYLYSVASYGAVWGSPKPCWVINDPEANTVEIENAVAWMPLPEYSANKAFQDVLPKTEEWARIHFDGRCPYTDKECEKWTCAQCEVNTEESREFDDLDEI